MRKLWLLGCTMLLLVACNDYGKKIKINDSVEVYVKGKDVSENDAKRLGDYLAKLSADSKNQKSLKLSKDSGKFVVRMVVDEERMKEDSVSDVNFLALKALVETEVFSGKPIKFVLTDNRFKDFKSY
jgi:transcriptional regulator of nitric oxide reductase